MVAILKLKDPKSLKASRKDAHWWMDSGSDIHITYDRGLFNSFQPTQKSVMGVSSKPLKIERTGSVTLQCNVEGIRKQLTMQNAHYCPDAEYNLFSIGTAEIKGFEFSIKNVKITCFNKSEEVTLSGTKNGATYHLDLYDDIEKSLRTDTSSVSWTS